MTLYGVDISDHQPGFDWPAYAAEGHSFAMIKATEGQTFVANTFDKYRHEMAQAGLIYRGFYHFARPDTNGGNITDARAEAAHFVRTVESLSVGEGLMLDYEPDPRTLSKEGHEDWCIAWIDAVEAAIPGIAGRILFYANRSLVSFMSTDRLVTRCPLDVAAYGSNDGHEHPASLGLSTFPGRVDRWAAPTFWQFTSVGHVAGFRGHVDLNRFVGDEAALKALALH
jgi:lysozyme